VISHASGTSVADRRLRVLLVGPSLDILGGQAVQAQRLFDRLKAVNGLEVDFLPVNPRLPGPLRVLQRVKYVRTVATTIAFVLSLFPRCLKVDVIHAYSAGYWSFLLAPVPAMLVGRLLGRKVVLNYHTGEAADHLNRHRSFAIPLMRLAHAIVVPSQFLVEVFAQFGLKALAIANFVDLDLLPHRDRPKPAPHLLSTRNLERLYNVACTLRAFALVKAQIPDATLTVAGRGSEDRALKALARDLGPLDVTFVGAVPPDQMGALYNSVDIYVNSPDIDNMPLSIIEAFACGLPVVSTNAGGIPFIVQHNENGLLADRNDETGLAAAILRLITEPGLAARLSAEAYGHVLKHYTWDAVGCHWHHLYRSVSNGQESG